MKSNGIVITVSLSEKGKSCHLLQWNIYKLRNYPTLHSSYVLFEKQKQDTQNLRTRAFGCLNRALNLSIPAGKSSAISGQSLLVNLPNTIFPSKHYKHIIKIAVSIPPALMLLVI